MSEYKSKTVVVDQPQMALFTAFTNPEAVLAALPEDKREAVSVQGDTISISYAGFTIVMRITQKVQFSKVVLEGVDTPFPFSITFHFDPAPLITQTSLTICVEAELNFMMRAMLGPKIQEALDQIVLAISNGGLLTR